MAAKMRSPIRKGTFTGPRESEIRNGWLRICYTMWARAANAAGMILLYLTKWEDYTPG